MSDIRRARKALVARILEGDGKASIAQRRAAFDNAGLAEPLSMLVEKVAKDAYKVTDEDIAAARARGLSEDQIFEIVVCAAIGQAARQYDTALAALEAATERSEHASRGSRSRTPSRSVSRSTRSIGWPIPSSSPCRVPSSSRPTRSSCSRAATADHGFIAHVAHGLCLNLRTRRIPHGLLEQNSIAARVTQTMGRLNQRLIDVELGEFRHRLKIDIFWIIGVMHEDTPGHRIYFYCLNTGKAGQVILDKKEIASIGLLRGNF